MKNKNNVYRYTKNCKNRSNKSRLVICLEYEGEVDLSDAQNGKEIYKRYTQSENKDKTANDRKFPGKNRRKNAVDFDTLPPLEISFDECLERGFQFADPNAGYPFSEGEVISGIDRSVLRVKLNSALALLTKEEREYIVLRFVDCFSQEKIATELGKTQKQISRFEDKLLSKMRKMMTSES